ncbi:type IV toxin-antitoxin system AbiEi family antitoxin [Sinomonas sp. ASV322]|uniref:type IV toxin-antitoxin system AbiEi family antitoxin n=1 Tax=Sinomonas sp. ASV322 TaxID=3041920 RepID=UPI0027DB718F|nr:type IV toxin-antitoxin system AbiEi family antitoxin [Sinomonas sp. ASV322]MDQ4501155.1 type IV toxin-antitoxin system AbiEi family antitoxin [Sinomonas sp. ASV322]
MHSESPPRGSVRPLSRTEVILTPGSPFTHAELRAMAIDGVVRRVVGTAYASSAHEETAALRAAALGATLDAGIANKAVVGRLSAAWIYGCSAAPEAPVLLVPAPRRLSSAGKGPGILLHEVALGDFDVVDLGPVQVTSPLRTAVDIAVHTEAKTALPVLRRLLARPGLGLTLSLMRRALESLPRQPHKRRGREVLHRLEAGAAASA